MPDPEPVPERFQLGDWLVEPTAGTARRGSSERRLRPQEMDLLVVLVAHPRRVVSREELFAAVWGDAAVEEGALPRCISLVRKALGDSPRQPRYIETVPKRGYRLIAEVGPAVPGSSAAGSRPPGRDGEPPPPEEAPAASPGTASGGSPTGPGDPGPAIETRRRRSRRRLAALSTLPVAVLVWLGLRAAAPPEPSPLEGPGRGEVLLRPDLPTVAVPAFRSLAPAVGHEWLGEGLAEMISTELALSPQIQLVPRELIHRQEKLGREAAPGELPQVPEDRMEVLLGHDLVVFGSYLVQTGEGRRESTLRLDLKLVESESGQAVTALVRQGALGDLSRLVRDAGEGLRRALPGAGGEARPPDTVAGLPEDPEAIRLYTDALLLLGRYRPAAAREKLEQALALEPDQPYAQLALADTWDRQGQVSKAAEAGSTAATLAEDLPPNQRLWIEARALGLASRWRDAAAIYRKLWDASPQTLEYGLDLAQAQVNARQGRTALETVGELRGRAGPDHREARIDHLEARAAAVLGDHRRRLEAAARAALLARSAGPSKTLAEALTEAAHAHWELGQVEAAWSRYREAEELLLASGDRTALAWLRYTAASWRAGKGETEAVEGELETVRATFQELGNRAAEAAVLRTLGSRAADRGDLPRAEAILSRALETFRAVGDPLGEASTLNKLGVSLAGAGELRRAGPVFSDALNLYRRIGNRDMEQGVLANLARVAELEGRITDSLARWEEAYGLALDLDSERTMAGVQFNRGNALVLAGDPRSSITALAEAVELYRRLDDPRMLAAALDCLGQVQLSTLDLEAARAHIAEAFTLRLALGHPSRLAGSYRSRARLHLVAGELGEAEAAARKGLSMAVQFSSPATHDRALLAWILMLRGRTEEAWETLDREAASGGIPFSAGIRGADQKITAARLHSALGRFEEAKGLLGEVQSMADIGGAWQVWAEAELAFGELELRKGRSEGARNRLRTLEEASGRRGFERLARRARELLEENPTAPRGDQKG